MATASIYSNLTNEQAAFGLCGARLLNCSHMHSCLKLSFLPLQIGGALRASIKGSAFDR